MSAIYKDGMLVDSGVHHRRFLSIEHGVLPGVYAIVVHQTDSPTDQQNMSLQWLEEELYNHFSLASSDVYKHLEVSYEKSW